MEKHELDMLQIILSSGIVVKSVLLLLILMSVASWAIIFLKRRAIRNLKKITNNLRLFIDKVKT